MKKWDALILGRICIPNRETTNCSINHLNLEGTTADTPTLFTKESINGTVYAIVRQNNSKELKIVMRPYKLSHQPTEKELREFHRYSPYLNCAYSDYLPFLPMEEHLSCPNERANAIAMKDTIKEIEKEEDVVACSHRYGGWTGIEWNFGEDVKYIISTNFGFGSCSYFHLLVKYKDLLLTPYTDYIRYRYAEFSSMHRYTYAYAVSEDEWKNVMTDALNFYNDIVYKKEGYIFSWLIGHLERMTSGIEELRTAISFRFESPCNGSSTDVTGDELTLVKANKIANSLDFVENISVLPVQVMPKRYVDRILKVCSIYLSDLIRLIDKLEAEKKIAESKVESLTSIADYAIYADIRKRCYYRMNWHYNSKKRAMLRLLLRLQHLSLPRLSRDVRKMRIEALKLVIKEVEETQRVISKLDHLLYNLISCRNKIENYFEKEKSKTA